MAQHVHARRELALALLGEQAVEEVGAVVVAALFVPQDEAPLHLARVQLARQHLDKEERDFVLLHSCAGTVINRSELMRCLKFVSFCTADSLTDTDRATK